MQHGAAGLIVVDSVSSLIPLSEIQGEMGQAQMGSQARLMSAGMRRLAPVASKSNCTVIFINQLRQKIGVVFGNPEVTSGGNALKYFASVRLDIRKVSQPADKSGADVRNARHPIPPASAPYLAHVIVATGAELWSTAGRSGAPRREKHVMLSSPVNGRQLQVSARQTPTASPLTPPPPLCPASTRFCPSLQAKGIRCKVKVVKNKIAAPYRVVRTHSRNAVD